MLYLAAGVLGFSIGWLLSNTFSGPRRCAATIGQRGIHRCDAGADPRCKGGNCTSCCLELCECVRVAIEDEEDKRAAVDLGFFDEKSE